MNRQILLTLAGSAALTLAACSEGEAPKDRTAAPATPPEETQTQTPPLSTQPESSLIERAREAAREASQDARAQATRAAEAARAIAGEAAEQGRDIADRALEQGRAIGAEARARGESLAALTAERADALIGQARDALEKDRPDLAQQIVERLRQAGDSLSEGMRIELERLETRLAASGQAREPTPAPAATGH